MNTLNYKGDAPFALDVLDKGYVALRNIAGPTRRPHATFDADDVDIAQAARYSFGPESNKDRTREDDIRLMNYLISHWHTSPVEMVELWFEVKLPIFVARHFVRHRTGSINEISGRYITLPADWYIPEIVGAKPSKETGIKQGQVDTLDATEQDLFKEALQMHCEQGYENYQTALESGVAPEHARMFLSLNHYTIWLWKMDLHNLMHFLSLRIDGHAQIEDREYGNAILNLVEQHLPAAMQSFRTHRQFK